MGILTAPEFVDEIPERQRKGPRSKIGRILETVFDADEDRWALVATYDSRKTSSASASYMRRKFGKDFEFACRDTEVYAKAR